MAESGIKRKLLDLRVVELKSELEKRGLEKNGVKATLTERLRAALENEGLDSNTYEFHCSSVIETPPVKKMTKKKNEKSQDSEEDEEHTIFESLADLVAHENDTLEDSAVENGEIVHQSDLSEVDHVDGEDVETDHTGDEHAPQLKCDEQVEPDDEDEPMIVQDEENDQSAVDEEAEPANQTLNDKEDGDQSVNAVDSAPSVGGTTTASGQSESTTGADQAPPPNPETVEPSYPFTAQDTIDLHAATVKKMTSSSLGHALRTAVSANQSEEGGANKEREALNDETSSMYVNVDESVASIDDQPDQTDAASVVSNGNGGGAATANAAQPPQQAETPTVEPRSEIVAKEKEPENKDSKQNAVTAVKGQVVAKKTDTKTAEASVWVIGMASTIKAADLKSVFSKYGRVATAKVMSSKSKDDGNPQWYGYVTMGAAEEAAKCITNLHRTELHGKLISVERAGDSQGNPLPPRKVAAGVVRPPATAGATTTATATGDAKSQAPSQKVAATVGAASPSKKAPSTPVASSTTKLTSASSKVTTSSTPVGGDKEKLSARKSATAGDKESSATKTTTSAAESKPTTESSDKKKAGSEKSDKASSKDGKKDKERSTSKSKSSKDHKTEKGDSSTTNGKTQTAAVRAAAAARRRATTFTSSTTSRGRGAGTFRRPPPPSPPRGAYRGSGGYRGRGTFGRFAPSAFRRGRGSGPSYRGSYAPPPTSLISSRYGGVSSSSYRTPPMMSAPYGGDLSRRRREDEMLERMKQKEAEYKQREDVLRIQREKERLRFEREKLEREKLELQHQQQQMRMQVVYERNALAASSQLIGVKRAYEGLNPYSSPPEAKRVNYGTPASAPQMTGSSAQRSSRRSPPRSSYGGRNDSYNHHQRGSSSSNGGRYGTPAQPRTSSTSGGGGGSRRSYHDDLSSSAPYRSSASRRARGGRRPSPPGATPSRQSWRSAVDVDARSAAYGGGGGDANDWRRLASSPPTASPLGGTLTAPQWRALQSASSSSMYGAPGTENLSIYGSLSGLSSQGNSSYAQGANNVDRFDAYKYSSSSRRY